MPDVCRGSNSYVALSMDERAKVNRGQKIRCPQCGRMVKARLVMSDPSLHYQRGRLPRHNETTANPNEERT